MLKAKDSKQHYQDITVKGSINKKNYQLKTGKPLKRYGTSTRKNKNQSQNNLMHSSKMKKEDMSTSNSKPTDNEKSNGHTAKRFRTQWDPDYIPDPGLKCDDPSLTVPDQNLSIKELLIRHSRGIPIGAQFRQGIYTEDEEGPWISDLTELQERREALHLRKQELEQQVQDEQEAQRLKRSEAGTEDETSPPESEN